MKTLFTRINQMKSVLLNAEPSGTLSDFQAEYLILKMWDLDDLVASTGSDQSLTVEHLSKLDILNFTNEESEKERLSLQLSSFYNELRLGEVLYHEHAEMVLRAFLMAESIHATLCKKSDGTWAFQIPAVWKKFDKHYYAALNTGDQYDRINNCFSILEKCPEHLGTLTLLAQTFDEINNLELAYKYINIAFNVIQRSITSGFNFYSSKLENGENSDVFLNSMFVFAELLHKKKQFSTRDGIVHSLLSLQDTDSFNLKQHEMYSPEGAKREPFLM